MTHYLVRFGAFGTVAPFSSESPEVYHRGDNVICRTVRGLELGEILTAVDAEEFVDAGSSAPGIVLRKVSQQDRLLSKRLEKNRLAAIQECGKKLESLQLDVALMDAELLFDGKSLFFYFLGDVNGELESVTRELAETYESKVQFRKFTDAVNTGCGPGCGTEEASGCSTGGGCGSCSLAGGCSTKASK